MPLPEFHGEFPLSYGLRKRLPKSLELDGFDLGPQKTRFGNPIYGPVEQAPSIVGYASHTRFRVKSGKQEMQESLIGCLERTHSHLLVDRVVDSLMGNGFLVQEAFPESEQERNPNIKNWIYQLRRRGIIHVLRTVYNPTLHETLLYFDRPLPSSQELNLDGLRKSFKMFEDKPDFQKPGQKPELLVRRIDLKNP